jgi:hypothetical protein
MPGGRGEGGEWVVGLAGFTFVGLDSFDWSVVYFACL